jgi:hypothetical protein
MSERFIEPDWSEVYLRLLDAIGAYMDTIAERSDTTINERDITIIRALIEFYDFEVDSWEDVLDVLSDVVTRTKELEVEDENESRH